MFALEKKLYAWELEQAYLLRKILRVFLGLFFFMFYFVLKCLFSFAQFLVARPKLYRQLAPNKHEEIHPINNHFCGLLKN
jgi:hypothetical protein